ncbi:TetR/AcrR family transcriptional regulator, partial [Bacillus sp. JJ1533]|uniref:TetR/AcrR family transcriptional regulator n=1 Tax=Bacillus sp. JJ1533 TaxID=3122959 RepID=UPI002FFDB770
MDKKLTKRQLKALETKKAIFESAIKLFKENGFDNVLVEDITTEAGTSKGSFYTYFK